MTIFVKNIVFIFHDWFNIFDERHIGLILCGTDDIIMAANEQRPPFFLLNERKRINVDL